MTFTVWLLQKTSAATEDWSSHWKRRAQWGSKQERSDYCCVIWVVPQQAGATTVPEAFCVLSSLLPWQENSNHSATTMQCFVEAVVGIQDKKQQPFSPTASSSISVATKSINFTSPRSDWEPHLVPLTPIFTKSSSLLLTEIQESCGLFQWPMQKIYLLSFSETKLHGAMLLCLGLDLATLDPTRNLEQEEVVVTGRERLDGTRFSSLPAGTVAECPRSSHIPAVLLTLQTGAAPCQASPDPSTVLQWKLEGKIRVLGQQTQFLYYGHATAKLLCYRLFIKIVISIKQKLESNLSFEQGCYFCKSWKRSLKQMLGEIKNHLFFLTLFL